MITSELKEKRPPFFTRLSNLILLQVFFIFAAFGLLFLYPVEEKIETANPHIIEEKFSAISEKINKFNFNNNSLTCQKEIQELLEVSLNSSMSHLDYLNSIIYVFDSTESITCICQNNIASKDKLEIYDHNIIRSELKKTDNHLVQSIPSTQNLVYYYSFYIKENQKAVLVAEFEHHYFVTSESKVLYVFGLLFLGGILISLLTIYLIHKRIQEPLARLMKGFEKTTQGDLFYMVEANKDKEMNKLTESFNLMSKTLWDKDQKLKKYNKKLEDSNSNLLNSREFLRKVLNNSSSSIITTTPDGEIQVFNETAGEHFEISSDQAIGININKFFADEFVFDTKNVKIKDEIEVVCKKSDGTLFPAFVLVAPIYDSDINVASYLYVIRDITESKSIHNMMIRMDRYYTKGEMAGDIAHEINNFLAILSGNIELMPLILKKNDPVKIEQKLELMKKQVDRIVNFTDGLLEANDGDESFVQVDMNQLLEAVKAFLQPQNLFDYINIETDYSDELPLVHTKVGHIRQLFVNLIYNAGEAMDELEGEKSVKVTSELTGDDENKTVTVTVRDNGPGVLKDNIGYLFHKRFTTKPHGHGISLVACHKIIDTHIGSIEYTYDNGAVFTVVLPIQQKVEVLDDTCHSDSNSAYA